MAFDYGSIISAAGSIVSGLTGAAATSGANEMSKEIAGQNRVWQSTENQLNRNWEEKMWNAQNLYNSPSAMMQRYKEAGLNPYLVQKDGSSAIGSASSPGTPGMVGAPSMPSISPANPWSGLGSLGSALQLGLQSKGVDASAANQRAESVRTKWETAAMIFNKIGSKAYYEFIKNNPDMFLGDPETSLASREVKARIAQTEQSTANQDFALHLQKTYSPRQIEQSLSQGEYAISESVARLNTMRVSNDVAIKKLANDTLVSLAQAFKLEKEGQYYVASSETLNGLRQFVIASARAQSILLGNDVYYSNIYKNNFGDAASWLQSSDAKEMRRSGVEFDIKERGDQIHRFTQMVLQDMGNVIHVGYGNVNTNSVSHGYNVNQSSSKSESVNFNYNY